MQDLKLTTLLEKMVRAEIKRNTLQEGIDGFIDPKIPVKNIPTGWKSVLDKETKMIDYVKVFKHPESGKPMKVTLFVISEKEPYWHSYQLKTAALEGKMKTYTNSFANSGPIKNPVDAMNLMDKWYVSGKLYR